MQIETQVVRFTRKCTASRGGRLVDKARALGLRVVSYEKGETDRAAKAWRYGESIEVEVPAGSDPGNLEEAATAWAKASTHGNLPRG